MHVTTTPLGTEPPAALTAASSEPGTSPACSHSEKLAGELEANAIEHGTEHFIAARLKLSGAAVMVKAWDANGDRMPTFPDPTTMHFEEHSRGLLLTGA